MSENDNISYNSNVFFNLMLTKTAFIQTYNITAILQDIITI